MVPNRHFKKAGALHLQTPALRIFQVGKDLRRSVVQLSALAPDRAAQGVLLSGRENPQGQKSNPSSHTEFIVLQKCDGSELPHLLQASGEDIKPWVPIQTSIELPEHSSLAPIQLKHSVRRGEKGPKQPEIDAA